MNAVFICIKELLSAVLCFGETLKEAGLSHGIDSDTQALGSPVGQVLWLLSRRLHVTR